MLFRTRLAACVIVFTFFERIFGRRLKTAAPLRPGLDRVSRFVNWWESSFKNFGETDIAVISLCPYFAETHNVSKLNLQALPK